MVYADRKRVLFAVSPKNIQYKSCHGVGALLGIRKGQLFDLKAFLVRLSIKAYQFAPNANGNDTAARVQSLSVAELSVTSSGYLGNLQHDGFPEVAQLQSLQIAAVYSALPEGVGGGDWCLRNNLFQREPL